MSFTDEHGRDVPPRRPSSDECTVQGGYIDDDGTIEGKEHYATMSPGDFPDGGLGAWLVLAGATCNNFSTFGFINAWGVFQAYYEQTTLRHSSPSDIAWIGSIQYALVFLPGLLFGRLFDLGHFRLPFLFASLLLVLATFLVAECTKYWHFLLCQGFMIGLASGAIFAPTLAIIAHWFKKRRGIAIGIASAGASVGGTVFPVAARSLIGRVGFPWTMRIFGFVLMVSIGFSNMTLKRRLPPSNMSGGLFNIDAFKSAPFTVCCIAAFFGFFGLYTVLTYIDISAVTLGISPNVAFTLVAIANASSGFGRCGCGLLADRIGPINVMIPMTVLAGLLTYAWPFARSVASFTVIAIVYGFACGAYVALLPSAMVEFGKTEDVGRRMGMLMTILSLGALAGPPLSGAINSATGGFEAVGYFAGSTILVSVVLLCITRYLILRRLWGRL